MNVASLELCKELYEVSAWVGTDNVYTELGTVVYWPKEVQDKDPRPFNRDIPAYNLGYLLRKLPQYISIDVEMSRLEFHPLARDSVKWAIGYMKPGVFSSGWHIIAVDDTPEGCAAKLCIELFKQNILTKEQ